MQRLHGFLDRYDPYAAYRMALYKALTIASILVFVYWLWRPANYIAYILPAFNLSLYEMPILCSFKQKERTILFIFIAMIVCSISFYLIFPFRVSFLFYSIVFFSALYFLVQKMLSPLRNITMLIMSTSAIFMTLKPAGDLQVAYNILFSSLLSMTTIFLSLKLFKQSYIINWLLAQQKFIKALENDIDCSMAITSTHSFIEEVEHIDMVYAYRSLLAKKYLVHAYRISFNIRNIQFALNTIYYQEKNEVFWQMVKMHLQKLRNNMHHRRINNWSDKGLHPETVLQIHIVRYLERATKHWNRLCAIL